MGVAALAGVAAGGAQTSVRAGGVDRIWHTAREIMASGAIGGVRNASVIVPINMGTSARAARPWGGESVPREIADALDGIQFALASRPRWLRTSEHRETGTFSLACEFEAGQRIAAASASPTAVFTATVRGSAGTLHIARGGIAVESNGRWWEVRC